MAQSTLPVLSHPDFPQVAHSLLTQEVRRVETVLGSCCHEETVGSGENIKGWSCREIATVSDLETGCGYCLRHFDAVVAL